MDQINNNNPLQKYFRVPGLTVQLPSQGRFQTEGNLTFGINNDVSVLPMRAADELIMKNPDALMSGMALEQVIQSCVPSVKEPLQLPSPDIDALLLAIRVATYGNIMTIEAECPECKYENAYDVDVNTILETVTPLQDEYSIRLSDEVVAYMRPFNMRNSTQASNMVFQETRKMQLIEDEDLPDAERQRRINECFTRLNSMNMAMVADCVEKVVTPDGVVTDKKFIGDFVNNVSREWSAKMEEMLKTANEAGINKNHQVQCVKCNHEWETAVEFDPTNFFGQSS